MTWHRLMNIRETNDWDQETFDLVAEASQAGITLGSSFKIKFQQHDNFPIPSDGYVYDEIQISTSSYQGDGVTCEQIQCRMVSDCVG